MTPINDANSEGNPRAPKSRRKLMLRGLLDAWKDRAHDVAFPRQSKQSSHARPNDENSSASLYERLRVYGFFQRTNPALVATAEWEDLRQRVEEATRGALQRALQRFSEVEPSQAEPFTAVERSESRVTRELEEILRLERLHRAQRIDYSPDWLPDGDSSHRGNEPAARSRRKEDQLAEAERMQHALRVLQELDGLLLAYAAFFALMPNPRSRDVAELQLNEGAGATRAIATAHQVARSGEFFHSLDDWLEALERSIDPVYLAAADSRFQLGFGAQFRQTRDRSTEVILASASWPLVARARIRRYRAAMSDISRERASEQRARSLERAAAPYFAIPQSDIPFAARWSRAAEIADSREMQNKPAPVFSLLQWFLSAERPLRAAARALPSPIPTVRLIWQSPTANMSAHCLIPLAEDADDESSRALVIRFFDADGEPTRRFDGLSVDWFGVSVSVTEDRVAVPWWRVRESVGPTDILRRAGALFVDGALWIAQFETLAELTDNGASDRSDEFDSE